MGYLAAWGKLILEENMKSKISWHCPFELVLVVTTVRRRTLVRDLLRLEANLKQCKNIITIQLLLFTPDFQHTE